MAKQHSVTHRKANPTATVIALIFSGLVIVLAVLWYVATVAAEALSSTIQTVVYFSGFLVALAGVFTLGAWGYILVQRMAGAWHQRKAAAHSAELAAVEVEKQRALVEHQRAETRQLAIMPLTIKLGQAELPQVQILDPVVAEEMVTQIPLLEGLARSNGTSQTTPEEQRRLLRTILTAHSTAKLPSKGQLPLLAGGESIPDNVRLMDYMQGGASISDLFLGVGRPVEGGQVVPIRRPLAHLSHLAIGGTSGFGKSTLLKCLAWQFIHAREPVQVLFIDLQGVTFTLPFIEDSPRLVAPVATDIQAVLELLEWLAGEIERRQRLFQQWQGVDNIFAYNKAVRREGGEPLAPLVFGFEEYGLALETDPTPDKRVKKLTAIISQISRKTGIWGFFANQVWTSSQVSTLNRQNLATTILFYTRNPSESQALLHSRVASGHLKPGEAYAAIPGQTGLVHLQAPELGLQFEPQRRPDGAGGVNPHDPSAEMAITIEKPVSLKADPEEENLREFARLVLTEECTRQEAAQRIFNRDYGGSWVYNKLLPALERYQDQFSPPARVSSSASERVETAEFTAVEAEEEGEEA